MIYFIRMTLVFLWIAFATAIGTLVSCFRPFNPKNITFTSKLIAISRFIAGIKIVSRNLDKMNSYRPCVFISNHQDNLDIIPGSYSICDNTVTVGKKSLIYLPFFGLFYWLSGNILIDRSNRKRAFETMDVVAKNIKEKNLSVWIMAEGTRSKGRGLLPFKKGPFLTAIRAQVPIVPIAISTYTKHLNFNRFHAGTMIIEVLPPLETLGLTELDLNKLKEDAHAAMKSAIERIDREVIQ